MKRIFDIAVTALLLLVAAPVIAAIALTLRFTMGSPVIWRQLRPGYRGRPFTIFKFRTMSDAKAPDGSLLPDEQRLDSLGRFLRRTSLDELPELINVLRGEMSLVGPRPLLMQYLPRYTAEQMRRHDVKPGITGWAQINGRNSIAWEQKFSLDLWYVANHSIGLDVKILFLTVWKVLRCEGISQQGHPTMPEFLGNSS